MKGVKQQMKMSRIVNVAFGLVIGVALATSSAVSQDKVPTDHAYVGAKKCMPCHMSPAKGAQYKQWMGTKHAQAYKTLGTDEAKAAAKKMGIDDPQKSPKCLQCHVTGYHAPDSLKTEKYAMADGVTCESCHGPGSDYWKMPVMMGIAKGSMKAADYGLEMPTEETCMQCHLNTDKNPFSKKEFDFAAMKAKISHPNPQKAGK